MARGCVQASSQYLQSSTAAITSPLPATIACWAYRTDISVPWSGLVSLSNGAGNYYQMLGMTTGGVIYATAATPAGAISATGPALVKDQWYHIAGVWDAAGNVTLYVDGDDKATGTGAADHALFTKMAIGRRVQTSSHYWDGYVAELGIWDIALSAREVQALADYTAPILERRNDLQLYASLLDGYASEIGPQFTNNGTTDVAHIPMAYPIPDHRGGAIHRHPRIGGSAGICGVEIAHRVQGTAGTAVIRRDGITGTAGTCLITDIAPTYINAGNDDSCVLLLQFDRFDPDLGFRNTATGAASTTISTCSQAAQTTTESKFGIGSLECGGGGDYITADPSTDYGFAGNPWTADVWVKARRGDRVNLFAWWEDADNFLAIERVHSTGCTVQLQARYRVEGVDIFTATSDTDELVDVCSAWTHIALVRTDTQVALYVGGAEYATATVTGGVNPTQIDPSAWTLYIGRSLQVGNDALESFDGYMDQMSVAWEARWTAAFVPYSNPYIPPAITSIAGRSAVYGDWVSGTGGNCGVEIAPRVQSTAGTGAIHLAAIDGTAGTSRIIRTCIDGAAGTCGVETAARIQSTAGVARVKTTYTTSTAGQCARMNIACITGMGGESALRYAAIDGTAGDSALRYAAIDGTVGICRIEELDLDRYEIHTNIGSDPDLTSQPLAYTPTLPYSVPLAGEGVHHIVTRKRNRYGLVSSAETTYIELDADGVQVTLRPSEPTYEMAGGFDYGANLTGLYVYATDSPAQRADYWAIWSTIDGSTPDTEDEPTLVEMIKTDGVARLSHIVKRVSAGTCKAIVRTRRTSDGRESQNVAVVSQTVKATGPAPVVLEEKAAK